MSVRMFVRLAIAHCFVGAPILFACTAIFQAAVYTLGTPR